MELGFALLGRIVLFLKEVACSVGGRLIDNHCVWPQKDTTTGRTDNIFGFLAFGGFPQTYLGEMDKAVVTATAGVGSLGGTDFDFAIPLGNTMYAAGFADTDQFWLVLAVGYSYLIQHFDWVVGNHAVKHVLDFIGAGTLMGYDE